ncbi:MAG: family 20 glycosylhydrolase, partial [Alloprevotella sp.]|nr:family 20 glycosylhydrolase [Alloprevotella sp.]
FFTKEEVIRPLDVASIYKLNRFHWHLTDDQGWRVEIPEYPKLTTVGAVRKRSLTINDPTNGAEFYDDTEYGRGCYYTLDDLREVVAYAKERNIEIIPEVDLPGHMVAAIAAYPELSCDPSRTYEVRVAKGISTDVLNVGDDAVIDFLQCVLGHMAEVFPYDIIHLGGDECPTTAWQGNADCARRIQEEGLSGVDELQPWLVEKLGSYLRDNFGKRVLVWDELLAHWKSSYTVQPIVMAWRGQGYVSQAADKGFESIVVPYSPLYFDLLQISPDKMEIDAPYFGGYGDGSVNSVDRVYNFNPTANVGGREQYVLGTQANLWTESLSTMKEAEYCYYPRLIALSETAWLPASQKDFAGFYARLQHQAGVLDAKDVFYAKHYIEPADKTPLEAAIDEARAILADSTPGAVGYPDQAAYDALGTAVNAAEEDASNADALVLQLQAYKATPVAMPETGKVYKITSASTYYRNRYEGSSLYVDGNALRIHYTAQTEPEELWQFRSVEGNSTAYRLVSLLDGREVRLAAQANSAATFDGTGTNLVVRKATKPAGGYSYIPGVVNIKNGRYNLYAQLSGQVVANLDSTLCYPGTWRIEEVTDFTLWTKGLADKAAHLLETSVPGKAGEPTEEALAFLRGQVLEPAQAALADAGTPVSEQTYRELAARYDEFLRMERLSILDGIDEGYYYYIINAYHTSHYACANASSRSVEPKTFASTDGYKWALRKQTDGTLLIESKLTGTCAYVASNAADQRVRLGRDYKWTLKEVTTDQGNTAIAITDGSGAFSWYTNPSAWDYVLLKPYDWGASVWQFVKTTEEVPTGIRSLEADSDTASAVLYDMQGRQMVQTPQRGVYIQDGRKLVR